MGPPVRERPLHDLMDPLPVADFWAIGLETGGGGVYAKEMPRNTAGEHEISNPCRNGASSMGRKQLTLTLCLTGALIVFGACWDAAARALSTAPSALSPEETEIVRHVDRKAGEALELLERIVNINSGTMNFEGVRRVGSVFGERLDAIGFSTRWIDGEPFGRSGHLVAEHRGPGPKILLIGHLDTVFERESPFQNFERLDDRRARGPGIADMKGGNVILLLALETLQAAGLLQRMDIAVHLIGDEEHSGTPIEIARHELIEAARRADVAIGFENGDGNPETAIVGRRGSTSWELTVAGRSAHSSQVFSSGVGAGAIFEASRVVNEMRSEIQKFPGMALNVGLLIGGDKVHWEGSAPNGSVEAKSNIVPQAAVAWGDLRAVSPAQLGEAKKALRDIVSRSLPETTSEIRFRDSCPPFAATPGSRRLLAIYDSVSRDLGFGRVIAIDPTRVGAADIGFAAPFVGMALDGIGLGGEDDHTIRETGDLASLVSQSKRAAVLLYRLSNMSIAEVRSADSSR